MPLSPRLTFGLFCLLLAPAAHSDIPTVMPPAHCVRSATVLACADERGNHYSVATVGADITVAGFDARSQQRWVQTTTRHGALYLFSGLTSSGQVWIGVSRKVGWNVLSRVSSSSGEQGRLSCNRLSGCR